MKKLTAKLIVMALLVFASTVCFAADNVPIDVSAEVPAVLELGAWTKYFTGTNTVPIGDADSYNFGQLTHTLANSNEAGVWFSHKWFTTYLYASTGSRRYQIKQTCTGVTSGGNDINSAFVVTPNYSIDDHLSGQPAQGANPGTLGNPGLAVSTDHVIYTSDSAGQSKIIQAIYAIPNVSTVSGFEAIGLDQPQGVYSGQVTFTVVWY